MPFCRPTLPRHLLGVPAGPINCQPARPTSIPARPVLHVPSLPPDRSDAIVYSLCRFRIAIWLASCGSGSQPDCLDLSFVPNLPTIRLLLPCAGFDAPSQALRMTKVPHTVVGAWDTSASAGSVLKRMHRTERGSLHLGKTEGDITKVDLAYLRQSLVRIRLGLWGWQGKS